MIFCKLDKLTSSKFINIFKGNLNMQWKDKNLIVESLEENYFEIDIEELKYPELYDLILDL